MAQIPLGYRRQNKYRETRIKLHIRLCRHNFLSLVYVYVVICRHSGRDIFSISCMLYYVDSVYGSLAYNVRAQVQFFFSILRSQKCDLFFARFLSSLFSSSMIFVWWRILGKWLYICYARHQLNIPQASQKRVKKGEARRAEQ